MHIVILGHSYVRDLRDFSARVGGNRVRGWTIDYCCKPGASYDTYVKNPELLERALVRNPDILVVILGGNSISNDRTNTQVLNSCLSFYTLLRSKYQGIVVSSQVELRFYKPNNKFAAPQSDIFKRRRNRVNKFLYKSNFNDAVLMIAGPGRLDNRKYYRDSVHLNERGLGLYSHFLHETVEYCLFKFFY